jgi:hypothetical protein
MNNETPNAIPPDKFKFDDPRQNAIFDYLKRLVGEGAAYFYKDACRHMVTKPPFETTTHIVGHLLRELEGALRDVLGGITEIVPKNTPDGHKKQIEIILNGLGILNTDPIAVAWLGFTGENAFHNIAHRNNLDAPHPLDESFKERWETINLILLTVLEKFEAQYTKVFKSLDDLVKTITPTQSEVDRLKSHIPNNRVAHEYFFKKIDSPLWLPLLNDSDFFAQPPAPEKDIEGEGVRYPTWPVLIYLQKVALVSPDLTTQILSKIPETENGIVKASMIEITILLPKEKKLDLIACVKKWMNPNSQFFSSMKSTGLIKSLATDKEIDAALTLSRELLEFIPDPTAPKPIEGTDWIPSREPRTIIDKWQYARFLQDDFPDIAQQDPLKALTLLCDLLTRFYDLSHTGKTEEPPEDYSYISRPLIETSDHLHRDDVDDSLMGAILTVSINGIKEDPTFLEKSISELKKQKWPVFNRIILYLLSKYPSVNPDLTISHVLSTEFLDNPNYGYEYPLLLNNGFNLLTPEQKKAIFDFIEKAEVIKERISTRTEPTSAENSKKIVRGWQRDKLSIIASHLEGDRKKDYETMVVDLGKAEDEESRHRRSGVFVGPVSDVNAERISKMTLDEFIELLKTWQPKKGDFGFGPSKEGLGREIAASVKKEPAQFSTYAMSLINLDPTYVRNYLQAFAEIAQNDIPFEWKAIVDLGLWISEQPREIPERVVGDVFDEDVDWGWTRRAVISLISNGLNSNSIPYELHEKVWKIIAILTDDPNPAPEQELTRDGTLTEDAYGLTINTVRGEAMTAVVEYGLWITRLIDNLPEDKRPTLKGFALLPNIQSILEKHLKSDPSIAVRAIYGRYFPWILHLGHDWTLGHIKDIFPTGGFNTPLYDAAWETYITYVSVYNDVFEILRDQYMDAVKNLGTVTKMKSRIDRDNSLVGHLMTMFWRGKLGMDDILFTTFWKTADTDTMGHAMDFIGRSLHSMTEPLEPEETALLKSLWKYRIDEAEAAQDKTLYQKEMDAFGWWFESGKFDEAWAIKEFLRSLDIAKGMRSDYFVIDRLVILAESRPLEALQILEKLIRPDRPQWVIFGNENDLRTIFTRALHSPETAAQKMATDLINRLVARGYSSYSDLLLPPSIV